MQGAVRNRRDPSARPSSRQGGPYKPKAKAGAAQRESEGIVVPMMGATNNAAGGKGPCGGRVGGGGKREGMAGKPGPKHPRGPEPADKVRQLQRRLWVAAKRSPGRRFHALYDRIYRSDVLWEAWKRVRRNKGAAGVDAQTLAEIEEQRRRSLPRGDRHGAARRAVPAESGPAAVHPEGGREAAAAGHPDGPGPRGADGGEAGAGADLRGGFPSVLVRVPAPARRDEALWRRSGSSEPRVRTTCSTPTSRTTSAASTTRS